MGKAYGSARGGGGVEKEGKGERVVRAEAGEVSKNKRCGC